jgi:hypothetical protein
MSAGREPVDSKTRRHRTERPFRLWSLATASALARGVPKDVLAERIRLKRRARTRRLNVAGGSITNPDRMHSLFTMTKIARDNFARRSSMDEPMVPRSRADRSHSKIALHQTQKSWDALPPAPLVEPDGIEPTTSCLQSRRSPN